MEFATITAFIIFLATLVGAFAGGITMGVFHEKIIALPLGAESANRVEALETRATLAFKISMVFVGTGIVAGVITIVLGIFFL